MSRLLLDAVILSAAKDDSVVERSQNGVVVLTLLSPSKINLHLRVGGVDASGFHPLRSWMITTSLCDELTFDRSPTRKLTCDDPTLACDHSNLVSRAADALLRGRNDVGEVSIHLKKNIPAGAGLGGGSGNAATTLVGVNRLLKLGRSIAELRAIAATLGSDVPFFLGSPSAIATGRGEVLEPAPVPRRAPFAVLIFPPFGISTAAAYRRLDELRPVAPADALDPFDAAEWIDHTAHELHAELLNDLERAAFDLQPALAEISHDISYHCNPALMSGSGSTLFRLSPSNADATRMAVWIGENLHFRTTIVELGRPSGFSD